jgi:hypothetical protein
VWRCFLLLYCVVLGNLLCLCSFPGNQEWQERHNTEEESTVTHKRLVRSNAEKKILNSFLKKIKKIFNTHILPKNTPTFIYIDIQFYIVYNIPYWLALTQMDPLEAVTAFIYNCDYSWGWPPWGAETCCVINVVKNEHRNYVAYGGFIWLCEYTRNRMLNPTINSHMCFCLSPSGFPTWILNPDSPVIQERVQIRTKHFYKHQSVHRIL